MGNNTVKSFRQLPDLYQYFESYSLIPYDDFYDISFFQSIFNIRASEVESLKDKKMNNIMKSLNINVFSIHQKDLSNFKIKSFKNFLRVEGVTYNNKKKKFIYHYNINNKSMTIDSLS